MNVLLIGSKSDCNSYTEILKKAPDTTVLGAVTLINDKTIKALKRKYNPHTILFDSGVPHKRMDISVCLSAICSEFPKSTVVVMCEPEESEIFKNLGVYAVINTTITNVQLCDILKSAASEYGKNSVIANMIDEVDELTIKDRYDIKKGFSTGINKKVLLIGGISAVTVILMIIAISFSLSGGNGNIATFDETVETIGTTITSTTNISIQSSETTLTTSTDVKTAEMKILKNHVTVSKHTIPDKTKATTKKVPSTTKVIKIASSDDSDDNYNNNGGGSQKNYVSKKEKATKKQKTTVTKSKVTVDYNNNNWSNDKKEQTQITLSYRSKTLEVADSFTLTATVTPKNKKVKWTTSNEKIAKIKSTGYVKAVSLGTVTITATVDGQSASCTVRVIDRQ